MSSTILQMALIMGCGSIWRWLTPRGLEAQLTRHVITSLVFYVFLPALILDVLWHAELGLKSLQYSALGVLSIILTLGVSFLGGRLLRLPAEQMGAFLLATAFPNVTFLGLPVLEQLFGSWARSVVIQIDLFAVAPFLFTIGIIIVRHYGSDPHESGSNSLWSFLNAPPFWSMFIAVFLNLMGVATPEWLSSVLQRLANAVIPLMLFSMGLALSWQAVQLNKLPIAVVVVVLKMAFMPWMALNLVQVMDFLPQYQAAAIMDIAMPSMLMGVVLCDRYRLDSALYAMLVTITTAASVVTLPFWHQFLLKSLAF